MLQIVLASLCLAAPSPDAGVLTSSRVLEESSPSDWRRVDPSNTLYVDLPGGRVVIELAAGFAPAHVENIRTLAREHYFDDLAILRSQDNYVAQWGDPNADDRANAGDRAHAKSLGSARTKLPAEFSRPSQGLAFTKLSDGDVYAREVGWADGFPVGRDPRTGQIWLAHCYGVVGAGRNNPADSSTGAELYVVTGHSPRHLDRNITAVGRVLRGMELLSSLPRGTGALGFYEKTQQRVPLKHVTLASAISAADRTEWEALRTDTPTFQRWVEARRNRREPWFVYPVGHVELCNVPLPVRELASLAGQDTLKTQPLPTVQQLMDRYVHALGGRDVIHGHKSMTVRTKLAVPGKDFHLNRIVYFRGDKSREELTLADGRRYQSGYDGKIAWEINPNTGAAIIQGDQATSKARDADMYYPTHVLDYFKSMKVEDIAQFEGHTCFHIKGTNKWGKVNEHFYDTTTGLLAGYRFSSAWRGGAGEESLVFSDYKDFGGWMMPARIEHKELTRTLTETVSSVVFDSVTDSDVRLPDAVKILLKAKH